MEFQIQTERDLEIAIIQCKAGDSLVMPKAVFFTHQSRIKAKSNQLKVGYQQAEWPKGYLGPDSSAIEITFYKK